MIEVIIGGACGACARFYVTKSITEKCGITVYGTLAVNVVGSFILGALYIALTNQFVTPEQYKLAGVAFLGSFTTFSTFAVEGVTLIKKLGLIKGLIYCYVHTIVCLLFCFLGMFVMKVFLL